MVFRLSSYGQIPSKKMKLSQSKTCGFLIFALSLFIPVHFLPAGAPTDQVRETMDKLITILEDPTLGVTREANVKRERLIETADERIDWYSLCKSSLGRHWRGRTPEEKSAFVSLLTQYLAKNYANSIINNFSDIREIIYIDEKIDCEFAAVRIKAVTNQNIEYPLAYRLRRKSDSPQWEVFDIIIEGTSMVKNYRTQFDDIIRNSSFQELIERLKERIAEQQVTLK